MSRSSTSTIRIGDWLGRADALDLLRALTGASFAASALTRLGVPYRIIGREAIFARADIERVAVELIGAARQRVMVGRRARTMDGQRVFQRDRERDQVAA